MYHFRFGSVIAHVARRLKIGWPRQYTALMGLGSYALAGVDPTLTYTPAADTTPNQFTFTDQTGVATSTVITSAAITISGLSAGTSITLNASGGTIDKNGDANFLGSQIVQNGDTVRARVTSSASNSTAVNCTVAASPSGVQDTFTVTTQAASGGLSAPGVSGSIAFDSTITISSDGTHSFGSQGPTLAFFDDGRNYGADGSIVTTNAPLVGAYSGAELEGQVCLLGRNPVNGKGMRVSYVTAAERVTSGGARNNSINFGGTYTEVFAARSHRWITKGTYSGSFLKTIWFFDATAPSPGVWDIVHPTFNSSQDGTAIAGNNNGVTLDIGFGMTAHVNTTGGWNFWESWMKLGTAGNRAAQFRSTSSKGVYDTGILTSSLSSSGTGQFKCCNFLGWHGDEGDARVSGTNDWLAGELYIALGAGAAARVVIGDASTLAACRDLAICTVNSWSASSITATVRGYSTANLAGKYIHVIDANSSPVQFNTGFGRLIS